MTILKEYRPTDGPYAGLRAGVTYLGDKFVEYPLTECCGATGKGSESPTGVVCRKCYATVDAIYGDIRDYDGGDLFLSPEAAMELIHASVMVNNGGGLPDVDHLFAYTDCEEGCETDSWWEPCAHGYFGAYESGEMAGWINEAGNVTDEGIKEEIAWAHA